MFFLLVFLLVPGEIISPLGGNFGGGYTAVYEHGWPWIHMHRAVKYDFSQPGKQFPDIPQWDIPWMAWDNWQLWEADAKIMRIGKLIGNLAVGCVLLMSAMLSWHFYLRSRGSCLRFRMSDLLLLTAIIPSGLGWYMYSTRAYAYELAHSEPLWEENCIFVETYCGPLWLRRLIGTELAADAFFRVTEIAMQDVSEDQFHEVTQQLTNFSNLRILEIDAIERTARFYYSELKDLQSLRYLVLGNIRLDLEATEELARLTQLEEIVLYHWDIQDTRNVQRLMGALPHCRITSQPTWWVDDFSNWHPIIWSR